MNYLFVVAHPDDEVLGAGATIYKLIKDGNHVAVCTMANHAAARSNISATLAEDQNTAMGLLGVTKVYHGDFPNIQMNTIPHLKLVQFIEGCIEAFQANAIVTHHPSDTNNDHVMTSYAAQAASRLFQRKEGIAPLKEFIYNLAQIKSSSIHTRLSLQKGKYFLLSAHREENIDNERNFISLFSAINRMAQKYDLPILYSCHPRSKKKLKESGFCLDRRVIQHEPLGFHDYNCLQMNAFCVISDSGTLPEESSFFTSVGQPFPAVCIRTSTERPEALDKACLIISGIEEKGLLQSVDIAVNMNRNGDYGCPVPDYIEENVSSKIVKIIQSYTGIVNKMVWRKE